MALYEQFRAFWRTASWMSEQSASWAARHYSAKTQDVAARVMFRLMGQLAEDPNRLSPASAFYNDIDLHDLADVELTIAVEEEFAISIPEQDAVGILTIGELIEYVQRRLQDDAA